MLSTARKPASSRTQRIPGTKAPKTRPATSAVGHGGKHSGGSAREGAAKARPSAGAWGASGAGGSKADGLNVADGKGPQEEAEEEGEREPLDAVVDIELVLEGKQRGQKLWRS